MLSSLDEIPETLGEHLTAALNISLMNAPKLPHQSLVVKVFMSWYIDRNTIE